MVLKNFRAMSPEIRDVNPAQNSSDAAKIAYVNGTQRAPLDYSQEIRWQEAEVRVDHYTSMWIVSGLPTTHS